MEALLGFLFVGLFLPLVFISLRLEQQKNKFIQLMNLHRKGQIASNLSTMPQQRLSFDYRIRSSHLDEKDFVDHETAEIDYHDFVKQYFQRKQRLEFLKYALIVLLSLIWFFAPKSN